MKKFYTLIVLLFILLTVKGQAPASFTYQAILRNSEGVLKTNAAVTVKFEILQSSSSGTVVYTETHNATTTSTGLIDLDLGTGTTSSGSLSVIDWSTGVYYLRITVDGTIMGTSQLLSVPYALYSSKAGNGFSGNYADLTNAPDLTVGAVKKLSVTSETDDMEEALFEVKNKTGQTVFAVYNEGVRIFVDNGSAKGSKGGFAIGGFSTAKAEPQNYFVVNPDSIRMYVDDMATKGSKGGFAIGGFGNSKAIPQNLLVVNSDSIRGYIDTNTGKGSKGGFAIGGFGNSKGTGDEYLRVTHDSTRIYINTDATKGSKGGFAIGGFGNAKGVQNDFLSISPDSTNFYVRSQGGNSLSTFNILAVNENLSQKSMLRANSDTIDLKSVLNLQNNFTVFGNIGYTGAVEKLVLPTLTTTSPINVTETAAESGGTIVSDGGAVIIASGIVWGTTPGSTIALTTKTTDGTTTGSFTSSITGLTANTTYYVRSYATNSIGTGYGDEIMFVTLGAGGTVADSEGNVYNTVVIGTQTWMATNLKTTKYNDGSQIRNVKDDMTWQYLYEPAYSWYNNDSLTYHNSGNGVLYNWYTVQTGNLCPLGWHVPTMADYSALTTFLGGGFVAGGKLKEVGTTNWLAPNTGATNETGFTALPSGQRVYMGPFMDFGASGNWWSAEALSASEANYATVSNTSGELMVMPAFDQFGLSIRCLQGAPTLSVAVLNTAAITGIDYTSATSGGEVINDGGSTVTARGVCWSESPNPTLLDTYTNDGSGTGVFVSSLFSLQPGTTYYVRAYATNSSGTSYGDEVSFTTLLAK